MIYTPTQFFPLNFYSLGRKENSTDPDQLASKKPTGLDLHCFLKRIYPGLTLDVENVIRVINGSHLE